MAKTAAARQLGLTVPFRSGTPLRKKIGWHIAQGTVHAAVFDVSPEDATELMERNQGDDYRNRALSESTVSKYIGEMKRGWRLTGEPIIISRSGRLLNGQHRLQACIDAGVSFQTMMVFGIDDNAFAFMDQGSKRTAADIFSINGVGDYNRLASAALWVWRYHNNGMAPTGGHKGGPKPDQLYDFFKSRHSGLAESAHVAHWFSRAKLVAPSMMIALHYLCGSISGDRAAADLFFKKIATGEDLKKSDPALHVRNRLIEERVAGGRLADLYAAAFVVQAWNATREGRRLGMLRWRTDQAKDLPFPTIV